MHLGVEVVNGELLFLEHTASVLTEHLNLLR